PYAAAKSALMALTDSLAAEHEGSNVHFSCVLPGIVKTHFFDRPSYQSVSERYLQRAITPDQAADAIIGLLDRPRVQRFIPRHYRFLDLLRVLAPGFAHRLVARKSRPDD
ncbi:MAG: SDR family NAD(P)-dependent oxidoreductase, partial [Phycisphaeraceae bacterium]|nr:SDR family NAD(P)-dependent oxidoreductase [Phycisphaeraceae bacterium]